MKKPVLAIVAILLVALAFLAMKHRGNTSGTSAEANDNAAAINLVPVSVKDIAPMDLEEKINVTGSLKAATEVTVGTRMAGRVKAILVQKGDKVTRGKTLIQMDDSDQLIARENAKGMLASAEAAVSSANAAVGAANARVEQAKAQADQTLAGTDSNVRNAEEALNSARARVTQAEKTRDAQQASLQSAKDTAKAALDAAQARYRQVTTGARTQERQIAENNVALAKATYDNDRRTYERYKTLNDQGAVSKSMVDNAKAKMNVSKAQYDSAQQQLGMVQEGPRREEVDAAKAAVDQAQTAYNTAANNYDPQLAAAQSNVDIAVAGVAQAQAALDAAVTARRVNKMGQLEDYNNSRDVQTAIAAKDQAKAGLEQARAGLDQARAAVAAAQQNLSYMTITAPVDGVVSDRMVDLGAAVGGNVAVMKLTTQQALYFEADVSELEATRISSDQTVALHVDAMQSDRTSPYRADTAKPITGVVESVVPVVDARTRNFTVRVVVPRDSQLYPGMFARGEIVAARYPSTVAVPKDALVKKDSGYVVFIADGDTARECPVSLGATDGEYVQVLQNGVVSGQKLIITGQSSLKGGEKLEIK